MAVREAEYLAVQNAVPIERAGRLDDLGELLADVVEVAAVEPHFRPAAVELSPDAVVLVLDPYHGAQAGEDVGGIFGRRREHELDRMEQPQMGLGQAILFGEDRGFARVPGQHQGHPDGRLWPPERVGDGRLQQPFSQPDAHFAGENFDHVLGGQRIAASQQRRKRGPLGRRSGDRTDGGVGLGNLDQARRQARVGRVGPEVQNGGHGHAQVRGLVVCGAEGAGGGAGKPRDDGRDGRPAQPNRPLIGLRKRPPGQKCCGGTQLPGRKCCQVASEQRGLLGRASGPRDTFGQLAPATHGRDGIPSLRQARSAPHDRSTLANRRPEWLLLLKVNPGVPRPYRAGSSC